YVYGHSCRRKYILDYFKDAGAQECNVCDNCVSGLKASEDENLYCHSRESGNLDDIKRDSRFRGNDTNAEIIIETKLTQLQTYELYQQGLSIDEIAQTRDLKPATIIQHFCFLLEHGKDIDIDKFVDGKKQKLIQQTAKKIGTDSLTPIKEKLGDEISWDEIRLVLAGLTK
ncbi:MAG: helix-turn-helix domain-containing protein, partial [Patescibacteria group bacterium]